MAASQAGRSRGTPTGAGNKAIATLVLEGLATRGERATEERGRRALEAAGIDLPTAPAWLADGAVRALFAAADVDPARARALGHKLLVPEATGLSLYRLGLGTPEKAFRRVQALLPREEVGGAWQVKRIDDGSAQLAYRPAEVGSASRTEAALCALRRGMLEAVPGLYGLLPAGVEETQCVASGAAACTYDVRWTPHARTARSVGMLIGGALALVLLALPLGGGAFDPLRIALALSGFGLSTLAGFALDLHRQLAAVAGARRGHLALFDQVDVALAEKLDALARAEAKLEGPVESSPLRRGPASAPATAETEPARQTERDREIDTVARRIHAAAGDLECHFDARAAEDGAGRIDDERGLVRDIREWAARLGRFDVDGGVVRRERVDAERLVRRAIAAARPSLPPSAKIVLDAPASLPPLVCEPVQIEHVVIQLLRNAVEASVELSDAPEVVVRLAPAVNGLELCVEDRGVGIESSAIDEVFDPFFGDRPPGAGGGLGLKVCLRIVERHGGELRFDNGSGVGTRVSVLLPSRARDDQEDPA